MNTTNNCDNCGLITNKHRQKNTKHHFCNMKCRDEFRNKKIPIFNCDHCSKLIKKQKDGEHVFCNLNCKSLFGLKKYDHLFKTFNNNPDEVAYLIGLIFGDGHFKKSGGHTTRISIAFNVADHAGLDIAKYVMSFLKITYFIEPKTPNNCKTLGFIIPNKLLNHYGILFHGNKFSNQPNCIDVIKNNINFSVGLFNSDGCFVNTKRKKTITFVNTVVSIINCMDQCLTKNGIQFNIYKYKYKHQNWRERMTIHIGKKESRIKILSQKYCKWNTDNHSSKYCFLK